MVDHRLAIRRFHSRIALTGLREEGSRLGTVVGQAVREMLPGAAGSALAPMLGDREGVLRIDRIALKLCLDRRALSPAVLADALARQIAEAVAGRANGSRAQPRAGAGFAYWPDHYSYAASYIAMRMGLARAPAWAFADLDALGHLAGEDVALELIAARPAILSLLARQLGRRAAATWAAQLSEATASELVGRLAAAPPEGLAAEAVADVAAMLADLPAAPSRAPDAAAIAAACTLLATRPVQDGDAARRVVLLARVAVALAATRTAAIEHWGRAVHEKDLRPEALPNLPVRVRHLAEAGLAPLAGDPATRVALARLLGPAALRDAARSAPRTAGRTEATEARTISSPLAGIGLLMPALLAHDLPGLLSPAALHRTLVAAAGPEAGPMARLDPLIGALAPFDPHRPEAAFPPVAESLRAAVPPALREGEAEAEGARGWAGALIHAFASGLAGFEASTLGYLRREFLLRPGTLTIAGDRLTLVIDPLPLGILLRLRGPHGWTGRLPHVRGAALRIDVTES